MSALSLELLERSPEESARRLALAYIDDADEALRRFDDPEDVESLHDFRVALRRLRSCIRSYRPYVKGSVTKKLRRRLRELARSTNEARDVEVQLEWLASQRERLPEPERAGLDWLAGQLDSRRQQLTAGQLERAKVAYRELREELVGRVSSCEIRLDQPEVRSFLSVTGGLIREHGNVLRRYLRRIERTTDDEAIHDARIRAKRLRYLLEPLRKEVAVAKLFVDQLKELQDLLGTLHDTKITMDTVSAALEKNALDQAVQLRKTVLEPENDPQNSHQDAGPGLVALLEALKLRRESLFNQVRAEWTVEAATSFFDRVDRLACEMRLADAGKARRRRFLLERLPEGVRRSSGAIIDEGWLPGKAMHEQLRRTRVGRRIVYERIVSKPGFPRLSERIPKTVFEKLWSLTGARRLRRRRYEILENDAQWIMDELEAPRVVLAEVASVDHDGELRVPEWLVPYVKKEVTGERRYRGLDLAARAARRSGTDG